MWNQVTIDVEGDVSLVVQENAIGQPCTSSHEDMGGGRSMPCWDVMHSIASHKS